MRVIDWRGKEFGVGDMVVYPRTSGRSVEMSDGEVLEIWRVYRDSGTFKWVKLAEGESPPMQEEYDHRLRRMVTRPASTELRVRVKPTGLGSRRFYRGSWEDYKSVRYDGKTADVRPVTITNTENLTLLEL